LRELRPLFEAAGIAVIDLTQAGIPEAPEEDSLEVYATFEENALAKARYFRRRSGLPAVADDSGLVVAALGGAPGVLSKRWSGRTDLAGQALDDENNRLLLAKLDGVPHAGGSSNAAAANDRRASYVCAVAYVDDARELVCRGEVAGLIAREARGSNGFGYDPYFIADELGCSFGEATLEAKAAVSHRGRAIRELVRELAVGRTSG
jgi:XTP/dITP diphosphohydrolase